MSARRAGAGRPPQAAFRRVPCEADVEAVRALVAATGMFNDEEVTMAAELVQEALVTGPDCGYHFLFADATDAAAAPHHSPVSDARAHVQAGVRADRRVGLHGYACHGPVPATRESHDLYWIAVAPERQGCGLGRRLLAEVERDVTRAGGRRLYVDTAGRAAYAPTRAFYERAGYVRDATLADFYAPGDAKVIFRKLLPA